MVQQFTKDHVDKMDTSAFELSPVVVAAICLLRTPNFDSSSGSGISFVETMGVFATALIHTLKSPMDYQWSRHYLCLSSKKSRDLTLC